MTEKTRSSQSKPVKPIHDAEMVQDEAFEQCLADYQRNSTHLCGFFKQILDKIVVKTGFGSNNGYLS